MAIGEGQEFDDGAVPGKRAAKRARAGDEIEHLRPSLENCPVKPLGKSGGQFALMTPGGEVSIIRDKDLHSAGVLGGLFDGDTMWLRQCFPAADKPGGFVAASAANWLIRECVELGFFAPETDLRGPGAWRLKDGGLLLHLGDRIEVRRERGSPEVLESGIRYGRHIYISARAEPRPGDTPAESGEVRSFLGFLHNWRTGHSQDPRILLGWLGCAYLAGALRWRPHIWLTGDTSTGKSTLEQIIRDLLGSAALRSADPTKMAIAQQLAGAARPVLLDEFERDIDPGKQDAIVQLARLASTEDQAQIIRGSPEGRVRSYVIRGCFYFSGIVPSPLKPQDRTRIHVIDLRTLDGASSEQILEVNQTAAGIAGGLAPRLRARALAGFWRFQQNERVFEVAIRDGWKAGGRINDQMGTLLAMSQMLLEDEVVTLEGAMAVLAKFESVKDHLLGRPEETEAQLCLNHLLTTPLLVDKISKNIAEMITMVRDGSHTMILESPDHRELKRNGIAIVRIEGWADLAVAVSLQHRGLGEIFNGTRWNGGAWTPVLRRLPGSWAARDAIRFAGFRDRCTLIPIEALALDPVSSTDPGEEQVPGPGPQM